MSESSFFISQQTKFTGGLCNEGACECTLGTSCRGWKCSNCPRKLSVSFKSQRQYLRRKPWHIGMTISIFEIKVTSIILLIPIREGKVLEILTKRLTIAQRLNHRVYETSIFEVFHSYHTKRKCWKHFKWARAHFRPSVCVYGTLSDNCTFLWSSCNSRHNWRGFDLGGCGLFNLLHLHIIFIRFRRWSLSTQCFRGSSCLGFLWLFRAHLFIIEQQNWIQIRSKGGSEACCHCARGPVTVVTSFMGSKSFVVSFKFVSSVCYATGMQTANCTHSFWANDVKIWRCRYKSFHFSTLCNRTKKSASTFICTTDVTCWPMTAQSRYSHQRKISQQKQIITE